MNEKPELGAYSDRQLVAQAMRGDNACFGALVERYWAMAVALAAGRIEDHSEAEDVAQDSFVRAYCHLHKLRQPGRFGGWLSKIVAQECTNRIRKRGRVKLACGGEVSRLEAVAITANPGLTALQKQFIRRAVAQLAEKYRTIIVMRFIGGLNARDIADQLGKRPGTVRVWLHRAYKMLRKSLEPIAEEVNSL
jgi:RNA polymerase sigma-70 factor (ECF subfamily)